MNVSFVFTAVYWRFICWSYSPQPGARATDGVETKPSQAIIGFWICAFMTHGIILKGLRNIHASVTFKNQNHKRGGLRWWPFDHHIQLIIKRQRNVARNGEKSNQKDKFGTEDSPQWSILSPRNMQSCTFEPEGYISNFRWGNLAFSQTIRIRETGDILETEPGIYSLHHWKKKKKMVPQFSNSSFIYLFIFI